VRSSSLRQWPHIAQIRFVLPPYSLPLPHRATTLFTLPPSPLSSMGFANHSSFVQRVPSTPYGASKAGVRNMTHTLAMEWAKYGIRVNSVSPGLVNTAMTYWVPQQPDWEQQLKYYGGFPRLAEVQELGGAYVYLLSDAASYTTSIDIPVNGVIGSKLLFLSFPSLFSSNADSEYG
jgi:NAD(P)-dependent dehydrogenase (short-subunit alcohol dehydrogenase family)